MATCLIVQHVRPEEPYAIAAAIAAAGVTTDRRAVHDGAPLPADAAALDGLVVMGGPMSARHDTGFPTRTAEIALLADALERGVPTLGVCLGAQLLAVAAGGDVRPGSGPEVGWGPVTLTGDAARDGLFAGLPTSLPVLHWHGETYRRPPGATLLASSPAYEEQAFRVGSAAWGLQFHVEVDEVAVRRFVEHFGDEAAAAPGGPARVVAATPAHLAELEVPRATLLGRFAALVAERSQLARHA